MKKMLILLTLSFISFGSLQAQTCKDSDYVNFRTYLNSDTKEHVVPSDGGDHHFGSFFDFACRYRSNAPAPTQYCVTTSSTGVSITSAQESGELTNLAEDHFIGTDAKGGLQTGVNGATATTGGTAAGAVLDCLISCDVVIQLDGSSDGVGIKVSFPPNRVWGDEASDGIACGPVLDPTFHQSGGGGGGVCDPTVIKFNDPTNPDGPDDPPCTPGSPILIDTTGEGFKLTSAEDGVKFDIAGTGHPIKISWTSERSRNAFLALPQADGLVHSGKDLFGNFTTQDKSKHANGFLALAEWDEADQGGNHDGVIDEHDAVFSRLRLWIDENHDGISQPNELHTLPELGIYSLSLSYFESRRIDEFGNQFRYKARVNPDKRHRDRRDETESGEPGRWTYDVFFVTK